MTASQLLTETFTGKDGYLAWRAEWRRVYAELSQQIRTLRKNKAYHVGESRMAHKLCLRRKWSKLEAQSQYEKAKSEQNKVLLAQG